MSDKNTPWHMGLAALWRRVIRDQLWVDLLFAGAAAVVYQLYLGWMAGYGFDDSYITYAVAQNLGQGHGLTFNPGTRLQVTTTPLYTLYLAPFAWLGASLPEVSRFSSMLFLTADFTLILLIGRHLGSAWIGRLAAVLFLFNPLVLRTVGHETPLYMGLVLGACLAYFHRHLIPVAILLALAVLCRGDGVVIALVLLGAHLLEQRRFPVVPALVYVGIAGSWFLFAWLYFGSPLPNTLHAKIQQTAIYPERVSFLDTLIKLSLPHKLFTLIQVGLVAVGLFWASGRKGLVLMVWAAAYVFGYWMLGVPGLFFWWYVPLYPVVFLFLGAGAVALWRRLPKGERPWSGHLATAVVAGLLALMGWGLQKHYRHTYEYYVKSRSGPRAATSKVGTYRAVGQRWMKPCMKPDQRLAVAEIGALGYYGRRPILDLFGLASPEVLEHLRISPVDRAAVIAHHKPEFYGDFNWRRWTRQIRKTRPDQKFRKKGARAWKRHLRSLGYRKIVKDAYVFHRQIRVQQGPRRSYFMIWRRKDVTPPQGCGR
jgi:hypothetical protein